MTQMHKAMVVLGLLAGLLPAQSQEYLDGREVIRLTAESRYGEAFELARSRPSAYGQWAALMIWNRIAPSTYPYSTPEAYLRGYAEACRHMMVNKEAEVFCYLGIADVNNRRPLYSEVLSRPKEARLPNIRPQEALRGLVLLEKEGVPYARYLFRRNPAQGDPSQEEGRLRSLAERYPYSLGGAMAAGERALILWENQRYPEALRLAQPLAGIIASAGGVVAWAEYTSQGTGQNRESACRRAHFWARRSNPPPAVYTLGLCYLEGAGGLPRDPVEAYALFWLGDYLGFRYPGFKQALKRLEASLTPAQILEGRRRVVRYLP